MLIRSTLIVLIGLAAPFCLHAAEDPAARDEARRQFDLGVKRAREADYAAALAAFRKAYDASPNFSVLYNIAEVQRQLGDPASAVPTFERYLQEGGARISAERRAKVQALLEAEQRRTALVTFHLAPPSARVRLDGRWVDAAGVGTEEASMRVNAGTHEALAVMGDRASPARTFAVAPGEAVTITLVVPVPVAAPTFSTPRTARPAPSGPATPAPPVTPIPVHRPPRRCCARRPRPRARPAPPRPDSPIASPATRSPPLVWPGSASVSGPTSAPALRFRRLSTTGARPAKEAARATLAATTKTRGAD